MPSEPFVGEISIAGFNFAPTGNALCDGSLLAISQNAVLFELIGTTYGGDGQTTFGLPDLRGRVPVHLGLGYVIGQVGGVEQVTLTVPQLPSHNHQIAASAGGGNCQTTAGATLATPRDPAYCIPASGAAVAMGAAAIGLAGSSQPHDNMPPFLAMTYFIALYGIFPSQN